MPKAAYRSSFHDNNCPRWDSILGHIHCCETCYCWTTATIMLHKHKTAQMPHSYTQTLMSRKGDNPIKLPYASKQWHSLPSVLCISTTWHTSVTQSKLQRVGNSFINYDCQF